MKVGDTISYNGHPCEIVARKGGWTTLLRESGTTVKVRNGQLPGGSKATKAEKPAKAASGKHPKRGVYDGDVSKLKKGLGTTAGGNDTLDKDDRAARELRGLTVDEAIDVVARAVEKAGLADSIKAATEDLTKRFGKLNPGLARMSLGNVLRGALNTKD